MKRKLMILLMIVCIFTVSSNRIYADEGIDEFSSSEINIDNSENVELTEEMAVPAKDEQILLEEIEEIDEMQNVENYENKQAEFEWTAPEFADMKFSNNPDKIVLLGTVNIFNYVGSPNEKTYIVIESDYVLKNENGDVRFQISKDKNNWKPLVNNEIIVELTADDSGDYSQDLYFKISEVPSSKGSYTGNISFRVVREKLEQNEECIDENSLNEDSEEVKENDAVLEQVEQEIEEFNNIENNNPENNNELVNKEEQTSVESLEDEKGEIVKEIPLEEDDETIENSNTEAEEIPSQPLPIEQEIVLNSEKEDIVEEEIEEPCENKSEEDSMEYTSEDNVCEEIKEGC